MKNAKVVVSVPVRVQLNTSDPERHQWARVIDNRTGKTLHTGQLRYIRRLVKKRYNLTASI